MIPKFIHSTFLSITLLVFLGCSVGKSIETKQVYLDYIFYRSLYYAYNQDTSFLNDASEGVYMDLSKFSITGNLRNFLEAEAKKRAEEILPIDIIDYGEKKSIFKDLLDKYNNKQLSNEILKKIDTLGKNH